MCLGPDHFISLSKKVGARKPSIDCTGFEIKDTSEAPHSMEERKKDNSEVDIGVYV